MHTNLQSRQPAHELPGTALADSKDALDGVAVKVSLFKTWSSARMEPIRGSQADFAGIGGHSPCLLYVRER